MSEDFDVAIVGAGAGGGFTALQLCEAGFKVALLERGPRYQPETDYVLNFTDWDLRTDPLETALKQETTIDQSRSGDNPSQRGAFRYHRVQGVGGSTLHYQGEAHRLPEFAFRNASEFGWGVDWPISYQDLAPYYQRAEQLLGVAGEAGNPFKAEREAFPCPPHPLTQRSQILRKAAQQAGMLLLPNTLALPSKPQGDRPPCQHSGGCNFGCIFKAKSSVDQAIIPRAEKTGNLKLITRSQVTQILTNEKGEITGLKYQERNTSKTLAARRYVFAAGAVETPRLLLASKSTAWPSGFGNSADQIGRYFMETVTVSQTIRLRADFQTHRGPPIDSRIWDFARPLDAQTSGFVLGSTAYLYPSTGPVRHSVHTPGIGRAHKAAVRTSFGRQIELFGVTEQEPAKENRLSLSAETDPAGVPKAHIHSEYSQRDQRTIEAMKAKLSAWAAAAPTEQIGQHRSTLYRANATHVGGGCRMGNNPQQSVVNADGRLHNSPRCYITDASVLPSQGPGDSPSLTIQALAMRTADAMIADLKSS